MLADLSLARRVAWIWIVAAGGFYCYDILRDTGDSLTSNGRPLGDDFVNYWSGAFLAWHGRAAEVYNWPAYHAFQTGVVGEALGTYIYGYPPVLLVLTAPLTLLPYVPGLAVWLAAGWFAFWQWLRSALAGRDGLLLALATPAVFINAYGGQNGTWTAAFFGGGLCLLKRRPLLAGPLCGLMIYKPHLGLLIPVALIAGRQWIAVAGATISAGTLVVASVLLLGPENWGLYQPDGKILRQTILEQGAGGWHRLVSVFVSARLLGADVLSAYVAQAAVGLVAAGVVALAWFRDAPAPIRYALLVLGAFLATPYLLDYDLVVGAFVAVWLTRPENVVRHSQRTVLITVGLVLIAPLFTALLTNTTGFALGPLFVIPAFVLAARAAFGEPRPVHASAH